jgi:hypothetical protein
MKDLKIKAQTIMVEHKKTDKGRILGKTKWIKMIEISFEAK